MFSFLEIFSVFDVFDVLDFVLSKMLKEVVLGFVVWNMDDIVFLDNYEVFF